MSKIIRLTENDILALVKQSLSRLMTEKHVLKLPNSNQDDEQFDAPMNDTEMGANLQQQNDMPPMDDMGMEDGNMDGDTMGNENNDELSQIMSQLSIEQQSSVIKYAKSMIDDSADTSDTDNTQQNAQGEMPMYENNIVFDKREKTRKKKEIGNTNRKSPFISNR